jgi:DNA-nicking Smr family endonuclease
VTRKSRTLHPEERALWKRVSATVKPRKAQAVDAEDHTALAEPELAPKPVKPRSAKPALAPPQKPKAKPAPPPQKRDGEKRVRRGKLEIDASLDLHGHTQDSGRAALIGFLRAAQARGDRTVIVVTGKGRNSAQGSGEGVLKKRFPDWLASPDLKPLLSGYAKAHRDHGGDGAFYVFLKRK